MNGSTSRLRAAVVAAAVLACVTTAVAACGTGAVHSTSGLGNVDSTSPVASALPTPSDSVPTPTPTVADPIDVTPSSTPSSTPATPSGGDPTLKFPGPIYTGIKVTLPPIFVSDCVSYDPNALSLNSLGAGGYQLVSKGAGLLLLDNASDAVAAYNMARNFNKQCFIGRNNSRTGAEHYRHIVTYYKGSGPSNSLPTSDCSEYDHNALSVVNLGAAGYQLIAGGHALVLLDSDSDASKAKSMAASHSALCFIGRGNDRGAKRYQYIAEYWK